MKAARRLLKYSANRGNVGGLAGYAFVLSRGIAGRKDLLNSRRLYRKASKLGLGYAQLNYANILACGIGGSVKPQKAEYYYKKAIEQKVRDAKEFYAEFCQRQRRAAQEARAGANVLLAAVAREEMEALGASEEGMQKKRRGRPEGGRKKKAKGS